MGQWRSALVSYSSYLLKLEHFFSPTPPPLPTPPTGYRRLHQEGVRQEVQSHVALHRRPQFRLIRDARDAPLHLLLLGPGRRAALQERLDRCRP